MTAFATKYFVQGEIEKKWYIDRGVKEETIEVTGHPRFDPIITRTQIKKDQFIEKLKLNSEKNTILIITEYKQEQVFVEILEKLIEKTNFNIIL